MRQAAAHDVDDSWHRFRVASHARIRAFLTRVHDGEAPQKAYWATYDKIERRGKIHSEEEDPATFRGGFYRAVVKMFDITVQDRRVQGYNGLADWEEMRDYVFRKYAPDELDKAIADKVLLLHGGNAAWPRQQIATDLLRSDDIERVAMDLAFGTEDVPADKASDDDVVSRLDRLATIDAKAIALGTKVLHVFAPHKWPALTPRTVPEAGEELGFPIPRVEKPRDYLAFAEAMRAISKAKGHEDLDRTDIVVTDAAPVDDEDEPEPVE